MEHGFLCPSSWKWNIWKGSSDFPDELFQREIRVPFLQSHLCIRPSPPFFGKWNWFVQIVNAIPEWCPELRLTLFCPSGEQPIAQDRFQLAVICTDVTTSRPIKTLETINNFNDNVCYFRVYVSWAPQGEGQSMTRPLQTGPLSSCTNQCEGECVMLFWKILHTVSREDDVVIPFQHQHKIGRLSNKDGEGNDEYSTMICPR